MRLTNQFSVMGRRYDLAYGQANTWKRKLKNDKYELIENAGDKLGQIEDIEEYIEKGIWYSFGGNITYFNHIVSDMKQIGIVTDREIVWLDNNDCKKTWALTKEELE